MRLLIQSIIAAVAMCGFCAEAALARGGVTVNYGMPLGKFVATPSRSKASHAKRKAAAKRSKKAAAQRAAKKKRIAAQKRAAAKKRAAQKRKALQQKKIAAQKARAAAKRKRMAQAAERRKAKAAKAAAAETAKNKLAVAIPAPSPANETPVAEAPETSIEDNNSAAENTSASSGTAILNQQLARTTRDRNPDPATLPPAGAGQDGTAKIGELCRRFIPAVGVTITVPCEK